MTNQGGDYSPFMFGGSYGAGAGAGAGGAAGAGFGAEIPGSSRQNSNNARGVAGAGVGHCMHWPLSLQQGAQNSHPENPQIQQWQMQQMAQQQQMVQHDQKQNEAYSVPNSLPPVSYSTSQPQQWYSGNNGTECAQVGAPVVTYDFGDLKPQMTGNQEKMNRQGGGEMPYQPPMMNGAFPMNNNNMRSGMGMMKGQDGNNGQMTMKKRPWR